jgi:PAS domain S-box-containing protein
LTRHDFRYSTIIAAASFGAMLAISAIVVWLGFWFASQTLDAELERRHQHYHRFTELHFRTQLGHLENFLRVLSHNGVLVGRLREGNYSAVEELLGNAFFELDSGVLDILFVDPGGNQQIIDVSSSPYNSASIVRDAAAVPLSGGPRLITREMADGTVIAAFVSGLQIIDPISRAVTGRLFGGVILNDNSRVLRDLLDDTDLKAVALLVDGKTVSGVSTYDQISGTRVEGSESGAATTGTKITIPFTVTVDGPETVIEAVRVASPIADLQATYLRLLPIVIGLIIILAAMLSGFIRLVTMRSLSKLSHYADAVAATIEGGSHIPHFQSGPIREFNSLGDTIERVFTAFRESEYRAESVIDRAPAAIFAKDLDGRYIIANAEFLSVFDLRKDQVIGGFNEDLFPDEFVQEIKAFETSAADREDGMAVELTAPTAHGERAFLGVIFPLREDTGVIYAYCTILADITERKKAEIGLRHAKEEAEFANSAKTSFLAGVSHELRTPLNAIIGFSEMIVKEVLGKIENRNYVEYAEHIQSSGTHLLSLIGDVLDLSVIEARGEAVSDEALDIEQLGDDCVRMITDQASSAGIDIITDINLQGHALKADARRIRQILINLLTNAVKFTPRGGRIELSGCLQADGRIRLTVTDTGSGMDAATKAHAFEPFMQGSSSMVRNAEGAGLGLALVKRLAELHDAKLDCITAPDEGTTISILFPASRSVAAPPLASVQEAGQ